jgi:dihydrofolate synthase/folylpolyglutamate synthase
MKFQTFEEAVSYLYTYIPDKKEMLFGADNGIKRTKYMLSLLDNPQEKMQVVHIAGTSGKGSTSYLTSLLLKNHGLTVGLQVSPHIIDIRERFQINNELINEQEFVGYLNEVVDLVDSNKETEWGRLTYFELIVILSFYIFFKKGVNVAVIETGLGGFYDGTNVVTNSSKICILNSIGFDHQWILGNTLPEIAAQKAGIIQQNNTVVTIEQPTEILDVFKERAEEKKASLFIISPTNTFLNILISKEGTYFDFSFEDLRLQNLHLKMIGIHQASNASLALTALYLLSKRGLFQISKKIIRETLPVASFIGRFEIKTLNERTVIIDGAHNPQKMEAFIVSLKKLYPHQLFEFLIAFTKGKDYADTLKIILPLAQHIYITEFIKDQKNKALPSESAHTLVEVLEQLEYKNYSIIENNENLINILTKENKKMPLVVTGSLYLIGSVYKAIKNEE